MNRDTPHLKTMRTATPVIGIVLVFHGGAESGTASVRPWRLSYVRMALFAAAMSRALAWQGIEVRLLRNRLRGWNAPKQDPVRDARWALARLREERPNVPVVLVGHSMGGRVAFRVADDPAVVGIAGLAPWTPEGEPVDGVRDRSVLIVHGVDDRITDPRASHSFAERAQTVAARVARVELAGEGHAMLRRRATWTELSIAFIADVLRLSVPRRAAEFADTFAGPESLRIQL